MNYTWLCPFLHLVVIYNMAMIAAEKMGYLIGFADSIFMTLLTALGDLMWLLIRASVYILVWAIMAIILLGLTIAVASVALLLLPQDSLL